MSKAKRTSGTKGPKNGETNEVTAELETLRLPELQARYRDVVGETTKSPNRKFLIARIAEALAARPTEQEPDSAGDESVVCAPAESSEVVPGAEPTEEEACTPNAPAANPEPESEVVAGQPESQESPILAEAAPAAEATDDQVDSLPTPPAEAPSEAATTETGSAVEPAEKKKARGRFAAMTIADLQALYVEKVGRMSGSEHRGYLMWKIREAEKGRITVGPVQGRTRSSSEPRDIKVLPLSLETTMVEKMDAAWRAKGLKSRAEFLRQAIGTYLTQLGAKEAAALFFRE